MSNGNAASAFGSQLAGRPPFDADEVRDLVRRNWHLDAAVTPLVSERDQNWLVHLGDQPYAVAKIANAGDDAGHLELQQQLMHRLRTAGLPCPEPIMTAQGQATVELDGHLAWLVSYRTGTPLAEATPSPALFDDLGAVLGTAAVTLQNFDHPAAHRELQWDLAHAERVFAAYGEEIVDPDRAELLAQVQARFIHDVRPALPGLPHGVIHNDANDHNVLVRDDRVSALLDFGDAVHTALVIDLAVACAYAMLDRDDPWAVRGAIVGGYERHRRLLPGERAVLTDLISTRLAVSVCISAHQRALAPHDDYLSVSEAPAWRLLARLAQEQ